MGQKRCFSCVLSISPTNVSCSYSVIKHVNCIFGSERKLCFIMTTPSVWEIKYLNTNTTMWMHFFRLLHTGIYWNQLLLKCQNVPLKDSMLNYHSLLFANASKYKVKFNSKAFLIILARELIMLSFILNILEVVKVKWLTTPSWFICQYLCGGTLWTCFTYREIWHLWNINNYQNEVWPKTNPT